MATDKNAGLAGIIAGNTAIATVGKEGKGLTYRGYSIYDLAEHSTFEEVAYLLIYGRLPKQDELDDYKTRSAQFARPTCGAENRSRTDPLAALIRWT